jgi:hypothetical protein
MGHKVFRGISATQKLYRLAVSDFDRWNGPGDWRFGDLLLRLGETAAQRLEASSWFSAHIVSLLRFNLILPLTRSRAEHPSF